MALLPSSSRQVPLLQARARHQLIAMPAKIVAQLFGARAQPFQLLMRFQLVQRRRGVWGWPGFSLAQPRFPMSLPWTAAAGQAAVWGAAASGGGAAPPVGPSPLFFFGRLDGISCHSHATHAMPRMLLRSRMLSRQQTFALSMRLI